MFLLDFLQTPEEQTSCKWAAS